MTKDELNKIIENHQHWLNKDCEGWEEMRATLRYADLQEADLRGADLRGADLLGANMIAADLKNADLRGAILCCAILRSAILIDADLQDANLQDATLRWAILCGANLKNADLRAADLLIANLRDAKNIPFIPYACPDSGSFIGYKKAGNYIVMLEIPEDAKRLSATSRRCRCNKAKVLSIQNIDGSASGINEIASDHDSNFIYKVGEIVSVDNFDEDRWNDWSTGIHFFINRQEAIEYLEQER